jgi:hypothetical protein
MAEKDISIAIKTSADLAAAKQAEAALDGLEAQARQTDAALDAVAGSAGTGGGVAGRGKGAAAAIKELAEEAPKAAAGGRNLGAVMGQVGFQAQDFAVQVGGGTSALTAFAQQGSQLLGIFGPGGAIAGALLAVGAIAYRTFEATSAGGEDSAEAAEELAAALEKVREKVAATVSARESQSLEGFAATLEAEAEGYRRLNEEVARNIGLLQARRRAQAEIDSAQAALDLARIDADAGLSEEEKIRRRAVVQERLEQQRLQGRVAGAGERVALAQAEFRTRFGAAQEASSATDAAQAALAQARSERDQLEPRVIARRGLPGARDELGRALEEVRKFEEAGEFQDGKKLRPTVKAADDRLKAARARLEELESIAANEEQVAKFLALEKTIIEERAALVNERLKAEQDARKAAQDAARKRDQVAAEAEAETAAAVNSFELGRQTRNVVTTSRATEAAARSEQQRRDEERRQQEDADRARDAEARRRQQLGREGEGIADRLIAGAANGRQQAVLEQIGNRIAADPNGGGLGQLADAIEKMMGAADEARRRDLRQAMERIARLEAKLKTKGDSGS